MNKNLEDDHIGKSSMNKFIFNLDFLMCGVDDMPDVLFYGLSSRFMEDTPVYDECGEKMDWANFIFFIKNLEPRFQSGNWG